MKKIQTNDAPAAVGHYSQGIVHNGILYVSGQVATNPKTGEKIIDSIEAQTEQALRNLQAVLVAGGSDLNNVLKMTIYLSNIEHWSAVNGVVAKIYGDHRPARAVIPVGDFSDGLVIEIDAIAAVKNNE
ncbi:MAG TPA: Rid family detoxifying hydrolase [Pyrinomonadaceae bacterium]|jgi:reactive intermediate/imine deaminase|nr:Rid family detoxifying hydrolase [Pyrinomonadaceae bacterium]